MNMTTASSIYVNLPVKDLKKSIAFFTGLGFSFNQQFTDDTATCMILGPNLHAMLLTHEKFKGFAPHGMADARKGSEVLICLQLESRAKVEATIGHAVAGGGEIHRPAQDHGFMYESSFRDLDGHVWELVHMNMAALEQMQQQQQ